MEDKARKSCLIIKSDFESTRIVSVYRLRSRYGWSPLSPNCIAPYDNVVRCRLQTGNHKTQDYSIIKGSLSEW